MIHRALTWLAATVLLAACDPQPSSERLALRAAAGSDPVTAAIACADACTDGLLDLSIEYADDYYRAEDEIVLLQYRVDYELASSEERVPYFAAPLEVTLRPGDRTTLPLPVVGARQRRHMAESFGERPPRAKAELQIAGYDWDAQQVLLQVGFAIEWRLGGAATGGADTPDGGAGE